MRSVCRLDEIVPGSGVAALVEGRQVAVFRLEDGSVHATGNRDPFSGANVLSRGIVGDLAGELVVASPVYKQHFRLRDGRCVEDPSVEVPVYPARVEDGCVLVEVPRDVATTCCYCGVGCGVVASTDGKKILAVTGDTRHPANRGRLCTKGLALHLADPAGRGLYPEVLGERQSWDDALDFVALRFRECIEKHGPDAVAFYVSGQLLTEDYYVFNKLARGIVGTNNIDTNSRLCMASAVAGYKQTLGADAPPACYDDIEQAECLFVAGSNAAWAHPVLFRRIEAARPRHLVVVDPRRTETARAATLHLQLRPGTDVALFLGMLHVMRREGWLALSYVSSHTEGYAALEDMPEREAARICGIPEAQIREAARLFATSRATLSLYCQGLNQSTSGTAKNAALVNLHLAAGQIGRPGAGPLSLTGQPNAMGGREVGAMAALLPGHREVLSENDRNEIARLWGIERIPETPGRTAVELFEAIRSGEIRMVWIACTNPLHSMPRSRLVREALGRAELVVVQDAVRNTETAALADVFLPAAGWGEKEGTMTNSERAISRVRAAVPPPGEARPDWEIAVAFARKLHPEKRGLMSFNRVEDIFVEHRETTRGRDLDITGLSYALLDERGPQQWPFPAGAASGRRRLYGDGVFPTPSGRARFVATPYRPVAEETDREYPLALTTGRLRDQWHTMSRTGTIAKLLAHEPEPRVVLHPEDMGPIQDAQLVRVVSRRGQVVVRAGADPDLRKGTAFLPMHWGARFAGAGINELTLGDVDPVSKQPELKHCAVRVEPLELPWTLEAYGEAEDRAALFEALGPFMGIAPYTFRTLAGKGVRFSVAAALPLPEEIAGRIRSLLPLEAPPRGRVLCNCFDVAESEIEAFVARAPSLEALQEALKCGTGCGSCLPEVRRKLAA